MSWKLLNSGSSAVWEDDGVINAWLRRVCRSASLKQQLQRWPSCLRVWGIYSDDYNEHNGGKRKPKEEEKNTKGQWNKRPGYMSACFPPNNLIYEHRRWSLKGDLSPPASPADAHTNYATAKCEIYKCLRLSNVCICKLWPQICILGCTEGCKREEKGSLFSACSPQLYPDI